MEEKITTKKSLEEVVIETKTCKNCGIQFKITDKDLEFYEKVSPIFNGKKYQIPTPTHCPDCRQQRRYSYMNFQKLYKRTCHATGKQIISIHSPDRNYKIYDQKEWWSDDWDVMANGRDFDFNKGFYEQFDELLNEVPMINLINISSENSDYCALGGWNKNCYLIAGNNSESCLYSTYIVRSKSCIDNTFSINNQNSYECIDCDNSYKLFYSQFCENCSESYFLYNCVGCKNCIGSVNLVNQEYCVFNKQYTKEQYEKYLRENIIGNYSKIIDLKNKFQEHKIKYPVKHLRMINSEDSFGDNVSNLKNTFYCFDSNGVDGTIENSKYIDLATTISDNYDLSDATQISLSYDLLSCRCGKSIMFSVLCFDGNNIFYSYMCYNSNNLFGCIGLKNKEYCILNKQYTKEEYEQLVPKIIEYMKSTKERGEFFPIPISPFGYNETVASEYYEITRDEALNKGYKRQDKDYPINIPEGISTIKAQDLPETISEVGDEILQKAIICEVTGKPYRIVKPELEFYRRYNIPLPRKHPDQRHKERLLKRNPRKLYDRKCDKCGVDMKTTYSPERNEKVYCEQCYKTEIYG